MKKDRTDKKPWPTKEAMIQIYEKNLWGGNVDFYSGEGSHHPLILNPYMEAVISILTSFESPIQVCDLGCGDFNVGRQLVKHTKNYKAVDIVPSLIEFNKKKYKNLNVKFECLDIAKNELPEADCAILRQVLQHLSNSEIKSILDKLYQYKYLILTEHLPHGSFTPNKDIISGQGIRLKKNSGIDILESPFNFKVKSEKLLSNIVLENQKGCLVTKLYQI
ncbi:class I SAM-dependent methyltransferase [Psychroflexus halocasei]|uniref:Methyltransferase domain-containing protein n=1 Tax=Psychroflexus halocasei TaxID=908615 RepID=A0A1H3ZCU1_9FLAO|nr:class I SAM-dependent methyltransferase [Psychroflexus halocasei]SEA21596.1 Methyltransferase domain-containing protein [Psychroflexus halocasei]